MSWDLWGCEVCVYFQGWLIEIYVFLGDCSNNMPWIQELRKLMVAQLKRDIECYDGSIVYVSIILLGLQVSVMFLLGFSWIFVASICVLDLQSLSSKNSRQRQKRDYLKNNMRLQKNIRIYYKNNSPLWPSPSPPLHQYLSLSVSHCGVFLYPWIKQKCGVSMVLVRGHVVSIDGNEFQALLVWCTNRVEVWGLLVEQKCGVSLSGAQEE